MSKIKTTLYVSWAEPDDFPWWRMLHALISRLSQDCLLVVVHVNVAFGSLKIMVHYLLMNVHLVNHSLFLQSRYN